MAPTANPARALRWMRRALVAGSVLLALLAGEVGLRFVGGVFHDNFTQPDYQRGWALRPGFAGWTADENTLWVRINSDGLRDREHSRTPPPNTVRVAVLGDSYMQGMNLPLERTFPSYLEASLNRCTRSGRSVESINFGVSGYGTAQELLTYRGHAAAYAPDVVVLAVYPSNDIYNNHRVLNPASPERAPYFVLDGDRLVLDDTFVSVLDATARQPWWRRWRMVATAHSRVAQLFYQGWAQWRAVPGPEDADHEDDGNPPVDFEHEIYRPPTIPEIADAWRVTEALLLTLAAEVRAHGSEFWVVTVTSDEQVHPDRAERQALASTLGVDSLLYPDRRIGDFATANGIPAIVLAEPLAEHSARHQVYLHGGYNTRVPLGTGHWNETANRLAADLVAARLCAASPAFSGPSASAR